MNGDCAFEDDPAGVSVRVRAESGPVQGSPAGIDLVPGRTKPLVDRSADGIRCQALEGKYGSAVAVSGDHAEREVATCLDHFLEMLGVTFVGELAAAGGTDGAAIASADGRALADAAATTRPHPGIEQFDRRYRKKCAEVIDGPPPERPPGCDPRVDRTCRSWWPATDARGRRGPAPPPAPTIAARRTHAAWSCSRWRTAGPGPGRGTMPDPSRRSEGPGTGRAAVRRIVERMASTCRSNRHRGRWSPLPASSLATGIA